jgi:hypothetical protein
MIERCPGKNNPLLLSARRIQFLLLSKEIVIRRQEQERDSIIQYVYVYNVKFQ